MRVSVQQQGGFLDLDRTITVQDRTITVSEAGGGATKEAVLAPDAAAEVSNLCAAAAREAPIAAADPVNGSDAMTTTIEVEDGDHRLAFTHESGQPIPAAVSELITAVERHAETS